MNKLDQMFGVGFGLIFHSFREEGQQPFYQGEKFLVEKLFGGMLLFSEFSRGELGFPLVGGRGFVGFVRGLGVGENLEITINGVEGAHELGEIVRPVLVAALS